MITSNTLLKFSKALPFAFTENCVDTVGKIELGPHGCHSCTPQNPTEGWGQGTVKTLAQLLQTREPGWKGFSAQNLWRMKQFFEAYDGDEELSTALRVLHPGAAQVFKDTYLVDFLALPPDHKEDDLQRGLLTKLKLFLTELGRDFCFVGEQFRLQVGIFAAGQTGGAVCNGTAGRGCG